MNRRGFLGSILAAAAAPAIVRADSLMRIMPTERLIIPRAASWAGAVRELRQYDVMWDRFVTRWDVAGYVAGQLQQFHVSIAQEREGRATYLSNRDDPVVLQAPYTPERDLVADRGLALEVLAGKVRDTGMLVVSDMLKLPDGMASARFLG